MAKKGVKRNPTQVYAFVDTNIFLDFYRTNNEATLKMLERLKPVKNRIICTYQVEMEFLKNRQTVLLDSLKEVKNPTSPTLPAIFANTSTSTSLKELTKLGKKKTDLLKKRIVKLLKSPSRNDVVYQVLEDIFQSQSDHVLTRDMQERHRIKRLALRRFLLGYPPRKNKDTSTGDALNWEWIIHCAKKFPGKIIIVSRDSDFGASVNDQSFLNDALRQEYRDRVGKRKSIVYTRRLSDALKELQIHVPENEVQAELDAIQTHLDYQLSSGHQHDIDATELLRQLFSVSDMEQ
jgi:predicted nucleic acid-binding protein